MGLDRETDRLGAGDAAASDWLRGGCRKGAGPVSAAVSRREGARLGSTPELPLGLALQTVGGLMAGEGAKVSAVRFWSEWWHQTARHDVCILVGAEAFGFFLQFAFAGVAGFCCVYFCIVPVVL